MNFWNLKVFIHFVNFHGFKTFTLIQHAFYDPYIVYYCLETSSFNLEKYVQHESQKLKFCRQKNFMFEKAILILQSMHNNN